MLSFPERMRNLVGNRDPVEVLQETPAQLASLVGEYSIEALRQRPFDGKWTPNEILGHLADNELIMCFRIKTVLFEDNPVLDGYSQEVWVTRQKHNQQEPHEHIATFERFRSENLMIWQAMTETESRNLYQRSDRGPESLGQMLVMHAGHDLSHLGQFERYLVAINRDSSA